MIKLCVCFLFIFTQKQDNQWTMAELIQKLNSIRIEYEGAEKRRRSLTRMFFSLTKKKIRNLIGFVDSLERFQRAMERHHCGRTLTLNNRLGKLLAKKARLKAKMNRIFGMSYVHLKDE